MPSEPASPKDLLRATNPTTERALVVTKRGSGNGETLVDLRRGTVLVQLGAPTTFAPEVPDGPSSW